MNRDPVVSTTDWHDRLCSAFNDRLDRDMAFSADVERTLINLAIDLCLGATRTTPRVFLRMLQQEESALNRGYKDIFSGSTKCRIWTTGSCEIRTSSFDGKELIFVLQKQH